MGIIERVRRWWGSRRAAASRAPQLEALEDRQLLAGSLSGYVYADMNHNGVRDPGDWPIAGTLVTLTGVNDLGQMVQVSTGTLPDGSYFFGGLRPGAYLITETQPGVYHQGTDNLGSLGGSVGHDQFFVALGQDQAGTGYNFGDVMPGGKVHAPRPKHVVRVTVAQPAASPLALISGLPGLGSRVRGGKRHGNAHHVLPLRVRRGQL
jgi:hypothetical protein